MVQIRGSEKDKRDIITTLQSDLKVIRSERDELSRQLEARDTLLDIRDKKIVDLQMRLDEKTQYIQDYLTGGNNLPLLILEGVQSEDGNQTGERMTLLNDSDFPLSQFNANVYNYNILQQHIINRPNRDPAIKRSLWDSAQVTFFSSADIPPNAKYGSNHDITLPWGEKRYYVIMGTRSQRFTQKMVAMKIGVDGNFWGYQVFDVKGTLLKERIDGLRSMPSGQEKEIVRKELAKIPTELKLQFIQ